MSERIPEWLAGELDDARLAELRAHLAGCAGCADEAAALERLWHELDAPVVEPSRELRARFDRLLAGAVAAERRRVVAIDRGERRRGPVLGTGVLRFAAAAATLAVGVLIGTELSGRRSEREAAELRAEMRSLRETVTLALLAEGSPSERLKGVAYGRELTVEDPSVTAALFRAMLEDPNVNVRLAALDALRPMAARPDGRPRLVAAVAAQESPLVQLSLIDLLLESDGAAARRDLAQLLDNPELDPVVRGYLRDRIGRSV
jgi:hypothetical protein